MQLSRWKLVIIFVLCILPFAPQALAAPPTITTISPTFGPVGTLVTITGSNFGTTQGTSTVTFNGRPASVNTWSSTTIHAWVPSFVTTGNVLVTVGNKTSNGVSFTVTPSITGLSVTTGAVGAAVTITGTNFGTTQGSSTLKFNGTTATVTTWSDTSIATNVPTGATTGNVVVHVGTFDSNGASFTVVPPPSITGLSVTSGAAGAAVTITGTNFGTTQGSGTVSFNGAIAAITSWSSTSIATTVPSAATTGNVIVNADGVNSNGSGFTVLPAPSISSLSPSSAPLGASVQINGANFGSPQGSGTVTLGGQLLAVTGWTASAITFTLPSNASDGNIIVNASGVASNAIWFNVSPTISGIAPTSGPIGTSVTVTGTAFGTPGGGYSGAVTVGGLNASITSWSNTSVTFKVPVLASAGAVSVVVGSPNGSLSNSFNFSLAPGINVLIPPAGPAGTIVTFKGSLFGSPQGSSTITFNGLAASTGQWSDTEFVATVPSGATQGPVVVTVNGVASSNATFTMGPGITGLSPTSGSLGTSVTITGSNFGASQGTSAVSFNGKIATPTNWTNSSITAPVPSGATSGTVSVTVGGIASNEVAFSVSPSVTGLSPSSGPTGTTVVVSGTSFGGTKGTSALTFNGTAAVPTSWSNTNISAPVPATATSGPVVVTVGGAASNGVTFITGSGSITGTITRASDGTAVSAAFIEVLQSNVTKASANSASDGTYTVSNLVPGTYDVRVSATGLGTSISVGQSIATGSPLTLNVALSSPGTASGLVTQSDGITAISGARVTALQGTDTSTSTTTNASGNYTIGNLSPGSYTLQVSAAGYNTQNQSGISITAGNTTTTNFSLPGQSLINYVYDELGRLVGVTDSLNGTAVYNYDPVGSLLSISRTALGQTSIINFTPRNGVAGTQVTINGTALSATPSQNAVTFNGTAATVTSATTTQLVVIVPPGATTGTISVTAPSGSATSATSFTVQTNSGAPTISGFTPTVGSPSTTVTVTGTNFDSIPANNRVKFYRGAGTGTTTGTSTSLTTSVPASGAGSGHLTLFTPTGTITSTGDFFVPPPPYVAANVGTGATGRLTAGQAQPLNGPTANQIGLLVFDDVALQKISVLSSASSGGSAVTIYNPDGSQLYSSTTFSGPSGSTYFLIPSLPQTGTYTLMLPELQTQTLATTTTFYNVPADATTQLTINGTQQTLTISTPGQNASATFVGSSGQSVTVHGSNTLGGNGTMQLLSTDGVTVLSSTYLFYNGGLGPVTLPANGTYKIYVNTFPSGPVTGTITLQVTNP